MSKIFLSHSHHDDAAAISLGQWLTANGWDDFFLDISPERGLSPGERWQEALKRAADRCEAVLFLISENWLASQWCLAEFLLAKQLGKVIFGVVIASVPIESLPAEMRNEWQLCDLVTGTERDTFHVRLEDSGRELDLSFASAGLLRLRRGLERAGLDASTFPWPPPSDPDRAPYSGFRALDREDAAVFFGRDAAITTTLDTLRRVRESGPERLFVILGASGSGKSSFLRAGLLPRLARDDRSFFVAPVVRPERAALTGPTGLLSAVEAAFRAVRAPKNRAVLRDGLTSPDRFAELLADLRTTVHARTGADSWPTLVFSVDQAEELFGTEHRAEAERLLELLQRGMLTTDRTGGTSGEPGMFTLVSIRSDSYERLQTERLMAGIKQQVVSLPPIPREEYKTIIEGPAARHDAAGHRLRVDPKLTEQLLRDTQGADALPVLAFTLERLFVECGGDGDLSLSDYESIGGIEGAIEAAVKTALADPAAEPTIPADEAEQHRVLRNGFIPWLAGVDPETEDRKRRVATWDEIPPESRPVLERLTNQRLLVRDRRRMPGAAVDTVVVEVAHEALLRRWPMLTLWLEQDADALKTIDVARRSANEWIKHGRRDAWLNHAAERLAIVEKVIQRPDLDSLLGGDGRAYVRACRARETTAAAEALAREKARQETELRAQQAEQAAERERLRVAQAEAAQASERAAAARRLSHRTLIGAAIAVVLMIAAIWAAKSARNQQRAAEHALGTLNMSQASRELADGHVPEAVAHLAAAARLQPDESVWRASLINALISHQWARITADIRTLEPAVLAVFSPDGARLLVVSGDEARVWDAATGTQIGEPLRHRNLVRDARFSADGRLIVTASADRTARIWDADTGAPRIDPIKHSAIVTAAWFSSDGRRLLTASGQQKRLFDTMNGTDLSRDFRTFSADGRFALASDDKTTRLWDVRANRQVGPDISARSGIVTAFSRDATFAAIGSGSVILTVNTTTGASLSVEARHYVSGLKFSMDGRFVAGWGGGGATVVDSRTRAAAGPTIRADDIVDVQLQTDGSRLLSVSRNYGSTSVRLWNVTDGSEVPIGAPAQAGALCGKDIAATAASGALTIWKGQVRVGRQIVHGAAVQSVTFTDDCRVGVSVAGREARVWDPRTGASIVQPLIHSTPVSGMAFAPDGRRLVTVSSAGARIWDVRAGEARPELVRYPDKYDRIALSADGERVVTTVGREVRVWNGRDGTVIDTVATMDEDLCSVDISPRGDRVLVVTCTGVGTFYETAGRAIGRPFRLGGRNSTGQNLHAISPDWKLLVTVTGKSARIWQIESGTRHGKLLTHRQPITSIAFSRDGASIVSASEDATARVWSAATGEPVGSSMRHEQAVRTAMFSADGKRVVTVFDKLIAEGESSVPHPREVRVWDARTGQSIGPAISHEDDVTAVALSPDGSRLLTASGSTASLSDPSSSLRVGNPIAFPEAVRSAIFSADGRRIVTAAGDSVYLWDAEGLTPIGRPARSEGAIQRLQFVSDEQRLLISAAKPSAQHPEEEPIDCYNGGCRVFVSWLDVPTADAGDVPLLANVAEMLAGYRVSALGALEPVAERGIGVMLRSHAKASKPSTGQRISEWLLTEDEPRPVAPLAAAAPPHPPGGARAH